MKTDAERLEIMSKALDDAKMHLIYIMHYVPDDFARQSVQHMMGHSGAVCAAAKRGLERLEEWKTIMNDKTIRLGDAGAHLYELTVSKPAPSGPFTMTTIEVESGPFTMTTIEVEADTRTQASAIAERAGYTVHDVNMIG